MITLPIQYQTKTAFVSATNSGTVTPSSTCHAQDTLILVSEDNFGDGTATQITGISDGYNAWHRATGVSDGNNVDVEVWYAYNIIGGVKPTITISYANSVSASITFTEYSGLITTDPLDKTVTATGSSTTPASGNTATLSQANELIIGVVGYGGVNTGTASNPVTGFGNLVQENNGSGALTQSALADKIVSATTAQSIGMTLSLTNEWGAICVTFKLNPSGLINIYRIQGYQ